MRNKPVLLVCAFKNEEEAVVGFLTDLYAKLEEEKINYRIILVDDGSTDRTYELLHEFDDESSQIISLSKNLGKIAAQAIGLKSQTDFGKGVIFFDGDGQHSPNQILRIINLGISSNGIVVGTRDKSYKRKTFAKIGTYFTSQIFKILKIQTNLNDAELIYLPNSFADKIVKNSDFGYLPINMLFHNSTIERVPISIADRVDFNNIKPKSRHTHQDLIKKALIQIFTKPWEIIYKLFIFAIIPSVFTFGYGLYIGVSNIMSGDKNGIASVIVLLSFSTIILLFILMLVLVFLASIEQRMRIVTAIDEELRND